MNTNDRLFLALLAYSVGGGELPDISKISARELLRITGMAQSHRVLPLIGEALADCPGLAERFPEQYAQMRGGVILQVAEQVRHETALYEVLAGFAAAGVRAAVVKGIVCRRLYPMPDWRTSSDEDLLVGERDFPAAEKYLLGAGFKRTDGAPGQTPEVHAAYRHPVTGLMLEVHVNLFISTTNTERRMNIPFESSLSRCEEIEVGGVGMLTLSPEDNLLYLVCHSLKHFMYTGFGVRQITDMMIFIERNKDRLDMKYVADMLCGIGAGGFFAAIADIGLRYFPGISTGCGRIPDLCGCRPDGDNMLEDVLAAGVYGKSSAERAQSGLITLRALSDADTDTSSRTGRKDADAGGNLWSVMFPRRIIIQRRYSYLNKYPWLLPLAWLQRFWDYCFGKKHCRNKRSNAEKSVALGKQRVALLHQYGILSVNGADDTSDTSGESGAGGTSGASGEKSDT